MDYSQFRRSENVEGVPQTDVQSLINRLTVPFQTAYQGLRDHPFLTQEQVQRQIYEQHNPPVNPAAPVPQLAKDAGIEQAGQQRPLDPNLIQRLLEHLNPKG